MGYLDAQSLHATFSCSNGDGEQAAMDSGHWEGSDTFSNSGNLAFTSTATWVGTPNPTSTCPSWTHQSDQWEGVTLRVSQNQADVLIYDLGTVN